MTPDEFIAKWRASELKERSAAQEHFVDRAGCSASRPRRRPTPRGTTSVSKAHEFGLHDLADAAVRDRLKWAMSDPERLRPGETRQTLTERAARTFAQLAQSLRDRGHTPREVAHFVNRLVFCMFAEDVGLLPGAMFTRMLEHARRAQETFETLARDLFGAMSEGGRVGFETVEWFNGGLFEDDATLPMDRAQIETTLEASELDWSNIDPSILGTLFERGLDPDKRSQLGAHYTDRDKIMRIIDPVVVRPLLAEWEAAKAGIAESVGRADEPGDWDILDIRTVWLKSLKSY